MTKVELTTFDAKSFAKRLYEFIRKPDGSGYPVFAEDSFPPFVGSLRKAVDVVNAHEVQLNGADGIKNHLDRLDAREAAHHTSQAQRLAAIEAQLSQSPFPA